MGFRPFHFRALPSLLLFFSLDAAGIDRSGERAYDLAMINYRSAAIIGSILGLIALSGCATAKSPVTGFWYTDIYSSEAVTSNPAGNKIGEACNMSILGLIATGDSSIETARRNGGITTITSVDYRSNSIAGVYAKYCAIVRGK